jgi:hypothetical protein
MTGRRVFPKLPSLLEAVEACGGELCIRDRATGRIFPLPANAYPRATGRDDAHMARMRAERQAPTKSE